MKMTTFIIGIILVVLIMTTFGLLLAGASQEYPEMVYNETDIESFDKLDEINNLTSQIQNRVKNQTTDRSLTDVVGGFIADGKDTVMLAANSYSIFEEMGNEGMEKVGLPRMFGAVMFAIVIITLFLGIILAIIIGREL